MHKAYIYNTHDCTININSKVFFFSHAYMIHASPQLKEFYVNFVG